MNRNTNHRARLGTLVGAFALILAAGCGTDVASAPAQISQPDAPKPDAPSTQQCHGSPQYGGFVCRGEGERQDDGERKGGRGQGGLAKPGSGPDGWT